MSIIKTILRNPLYTGTAYAIEYFIYFSVVPILGASIIDDFGLIIQRLDPLTLIMFGAAIAILIFFQKQLILTILETILING